MRTELPSRPLLRPDGSAHLGVPPGRRPGRWTAVAAGAAAVLLVLASLVWLARSGGSGDARVEVGSAATPAPAGGVLGVAEVAPPAPEAPPTTVAAPAPTTAPTPTTALAAAPRPTVTACRNSVDPGCGPFRFDPQPGPDSPMTVQVVAEPASPRAGEPVLFRLTLHDPDGVSHASSTFDFGDAGIGEMAPSGRCEKYGAWDPPGPDTAHATEAQDVRHTYSRPGTYTATFAFEAGPYECVDSTTGRGDRPYATSAAGSVTVVVRP